MAIELSEKQIKDGWQIVKFGEIAKEVKSTTKDPAGEGLEFYVGLDHLDPQSLRIARKGIIAEDNPSFTRRFSAGQILFGKRRCYQKKAAVADFEGICSGDIIVMDAIPKKIIPGLLPFIIQSDAFFDWAEKTSSGSLSPRTKWKSLAEFEFPLPPIERQKEILEVLEKVEEVEDKYNYLLKSTEKLLKSSMHKLFEPKVGWKKLKLNDVGEIITGKTPPKKDSKNWNGTFLWATAEDFKNKYINDTKLKITEKGARQVKSIPAGSVLVTCIASIGLNAIANVEMATNQQINSIVPKDEFSSEYLYYLMEHNVHFFRQMSGQTAVPIINKTDFSNFDFYFPNYSEQDSIAKKLKAIDSEIYSIKGNLIKIRDLRKSILHEKISGGVQ